MADPGDFAITRLGAQGDGVADTADGPLHVPYALPGETWEVLTGHDPELRGPPAPDRVQPPCRHFGTCGGCVAQHMAPQTYQAWKRDIVVQAFRHRGLDVPVDELIGVPTGSRRRAVLSAQRQGGRVRLGYHGRRSHDRIAIEECPVMAPAIVALLPVLEELVAATIQDVDDARVTVTMTESGADVSIDGKPMRSSPRQLQRIAEIATTARLARVTLGGNPMVERQAPHLTFGGAQVRLPPGEFVQAVPEAETAMTALVLEGVGRAREVADLFCGLGTFTLPLARRARVLAIDSSRILIGALTEATRHAQGVKPITTRVRDLFRDPLSPMEMKQFDAVVLDPPRAGAQAQCAQIAKSRVARVAMVSCNPATLARDVRILIDGGLQLDRVTPIDQFLYSAHVEAVATLSRR